MENVPNAPEKTAIFFWTAMKEIGALGQPSCVKVLDFGCGSGTLVHCFLALGFDAYGCDIEPYWQETSHADIERLTTIALTPYRLPFEDNTFDVVVSTSVMEHAQNKEEALSEIWRVLKVGGHAMHLFPSKWYLPVEPHIFVPLVNFFWPKCPKWWLALWAILGVRNEFQQDKSWKEVTEDNYTYCRQGLSYWSNRKFQALSLKVFGNCLAPMEFYLRNGYGGCAKLFRRFPFQGLSGWVAGEIRMFFTVSRKLIYDGGLGKPVSE